MYLFADIPFIVPIFVRGGAIIPTLQQERFAGELNSKGIPNPITFNVYLIVHMTYM